MRTRKNGERDKVGEMRRVRILFFVDEYWKNNGYSPTMQEIADATGLVGKPTALYHLRMLRTFGYITYEDRRSRTIRVIYNPYTEADLAEAREWVPKYTPPYTAKVFTEA